MNCFMVLAIVAFAIGSVPSGFLVGRIYGVDIRQHGSGNVGATNAGRVLGKRAGVVVLCFDVLKAVIAASLAPLCKAMPAPSILGLSIGGAEPAVLGTLAVLGHCYSPFLKFRGGKGVACGLGAFLIATPAAALLAVLAFSATFATTRFVSLASIIAAAVLPLSLAVADLSEFQMVPAATQAAAAVSALVIIVRHRSNIARLRAGTEPRFRSKKPEAS